MDLYHVPPSTTVRLTEWDPRDPKLAESRGEAKERLRELTKRLGELQELLYAEDRHQVLIVLQAMDTGGKDGTIRHVFKAVDPQGVKVASFKTPTDEELDHDYLWRVHEHTPASGEITIFNRSHYEDVLVVRVHNLAPEEVWSRRYDHINDFERLLAEEGTTILKFFLHISAEEQATRLRARLEKPTKHWKFSSADLAERERWNDYTAAYEAALSKTSTEYAPWYIVPADRKWYRNLVVASVIVDALEKLDMAYPPPEEELGEIVIR